jgi:hypothetical protein
MREADHGVLAFAAAHHLVLAEQVAQLLAIDADPAREHLARLERVGLIRRTRMLAADPGCYQITSAGLAAIASKLPPPRLDPGRYRHHVGAGWLWLLATKGGTFGPVEQALSEREMRARDTDRHSAELDAEPPTATPGPTQPTRQCFGVRPGGIEAPPSTRLHYPDVLLTTSTGRVPIELQLTRPSTQRLGAVMRGYAAAPGIRGVLYMTDDDRVGLDVKTMSDRLGISALIHLQRITIPAAEPA